MRSRRPKADWQLFSAVALLVLFCDLITKQLVSEGLFAGDYLGGLVRITLVNNPGAAFGIFPGARAVLIIIKILALATILVLVARGQVGRRGILTAPLAMIFGGALGNLLDRFRNGGEVIDFLDIGIESSRWYVFNVADASISIGAALLVLLLLRRPEPEDEMV